MIGAPPPTFELLELPCDNLNILGGDPVEVAKARPQVTAHLDELGFRSHEETDAEHYAISLGFAIDGLLGRVTMTPKRRARLEHALRFVERRPRLRGDELEHLVGHITFPLLVFRPLLSALNATYHFIRRHYRQRSGLGQRRSRAQHHPTAFTFHTERPPAAVGHPRIRYRRVYH